MSVLTKKVRFSTLLLSIGIASQASAWNFANDFSIASNPNGAWAYGIKSPSALGGALTLFPDSGQNASFMFWIDNAHQSLGAPAVAKNVSGGTINGIAPGQGNMHPGPNNEIATVRWQSPGAGSYDVSGKFFAGDGGAVDVYVYADGVSLLSQTGVTGDSPFNFVLNLTSTSVIDFMVGNAGSFFYDSTPLDVFITPVPEPAAIAGLLTASLLLLARRRS